MGRSRSIGRYFLRCCVGLVEDVAGIEDDVVALEECEVFLLEGFGAVMLALVLDIFNDLGENGFANCESSVSVLPREGALVEFAFNPEGSAAFDELDGFAKGHCGSDSK